MLTLLEWSAVAMKMTKVFKPEHPTGWSGIIWYGNSTQVPRDAPVCGWMGELCATDNEYTYSTILITLSLLTVLFLVTIVVALKRHRYETALKEISHITIQWDALEFATNSNRADSLNDIVANPASTYEGISGVELAFYQGKRVAMKKVGVGIIDFKNRDVLVDLKEMTSLAHDNLNAFVGLCIHATNLYIIMIYEQRGSLRDIIENDSIKLSIDFKVSLLLDVACGMWYIHQSHIEVHGTLTSHKCVVDGRWTCRITGHGLKVVRKQAKSSTSDTHREPAKLLWTSPELLRKTAITDIDRIKMADVYSYAIIAQEVFVEDEPFSMEINNLYPHQILEKVKAGTNPSFRPYLSDKFCPSGWNVLIEECWNEDPMKRPIFNQILVRINSIHRYKSMDIVDKMIQRLEKHTRDLEERVIDRTRDLQGEKLKVEALLRELLPPSIAEMLTIGQRVDSEVFDNVTIYFSDIVGFTRLSAKASPMEIIAMLNNMYTTFDDVAHQFDVYKVATIGDAYMVASGVPIRNGDKHAEEICNMAIALLESLECIEVPHKPGHHLQMRMGIHSGSCVAGVTGIKMPRYLLFGDTVDIAAYMESAGSSMQIHISDTTHVLIEHIPSLCLKLRGELMIKGVGFINTFWLTKQCSNNGSFVA